MAALFIWLNKHCFNGLYRTNKKGFFNAAYNYKKNISSVDESEILRLHNYLNKNNIKLLSSDFEDVCDSVQKDDFVYFDPPYFPLNETSNFTKYAKNDFKKEDHERLANLFKELDRRGAFLMLSNSNTPYIIDLYKNFKIHHFSVKRSVNRDGNKRHGEELIITNF